MFKELENLLHLSLNWREPLGENASLKENITFIGSIFHFQVLFVFRRSEGFCSTFSMRFSLEITI